MYLPQELINIVVQFSKDDLRVLFNLCLASRACFYEARPLMYKKVHVMPSHEPKVTALAKILFGTTHPPDLQLTSYIQELSIDAYYYPRLSDSALSTLLSVLRHTFTSTSKLTKLRFVFPDQCDDEFPVDPTLLGHSFQLKEFYWRDFRWCVHLQPTLDRFLACQPRIRTLEMVANSHLRSPNELDIPPTACPELKTFAGSFKYFQLLAPTRPIVNFVWSGVSPVPSSILESDSISAAFSRLRILVIHEGFPTEIDLDVLASHLTSLEGLHLSLENTRNTIQSYSQIRRGQKFVEHVHKLTKLRVFTLCVEPPQLQLCEQYQLVLTNRWFDALPNFDRAYFNGSMMDPDILSCWARGDAVRPRNTLIEEIYGIYREEFGFETSLLDPFFRNSRQPTSRKPKLYLDELGEWRQCDPRKESYFSIAKVQRLWWRNALFWKTAS